MAYKLITRFTRPATDVVWPKDNPWQTPEQIAAKDAYFDETFIATGIITDRSYTESDDGLTLDVNTIFRDLEARDAFNTDFAWWTVHQQGRAEYMAEYGITKELIDVGEV